MVKHTLKILHCEHRNIVKNVRSFLDIMHERVKKKICSHFAKIMLQKRQVNFQKEELRNVFQRP